jgi:GNAT superfamily N-acetyltransferase
MNPSLDIFWTEFFGVTPRTFAIPGTFVVPHKALIGYNGAWLFHHRSTLIVSVPECDVAMIKDAASKFLDHSRPLDLGDVSNLFGPRVGKMIGPAYQGMVINSEFRPVSDSKVRLIDESDRPSLIRFSEVFENDDWEDASIDAKLDEQVFIAVDGTKIVAAANAKEQDGATVIGVVTHPQFRGQGIGKAVVSAAVSFALRQGRPVRYQTLLDNKGSIRIAEALGIRDYARTIAVRFLK